MTTATINDTARYLTFRLGDELFAINVFKAREVLDVTHITRVPTAPDYMRGVVNVRGSSIPVVDLRKRFGLPPVADSKHTRIIVMDLEMDDSHLILGGLADSVHEVIELEASEINDPPTIGMRWRTDLILGMGRRDDQFIIILDIEKILSEGEARTLAADEAATPVGAGEED
ncbi:MAG: chemotaxis protein CheW [Opitutales bacterium]